MVRSGDAAAGMAVWAFASIDELTATTGKLTAKSAPTDIDSLLIMNEDFAVEQTSRTGVTVIQTEDPMLLDLRLGEPILLEIQQREQEIFEYLSSDLERLKAS